MIQYQCPQCGRQFSTDQPVSSVRCPYCGNEFNVAFSQQTPPQYGPQHAFGSSSTVGDIGLFDVGPSGKSRGVAGLLAILLGYLGVHYFYVGKTTGGFLCILLCLVTCGVWSVITLIQGIMMMAMRSGEFEQKYVYSTSTMPLF